MNLRMKMILILGLMTFALFILLYLLTNQVVRQGFVQIEEVYAQKNMERVFEALKRKEETLDSKVADWATWDDMYTFVQDRNQKFIDSSLSPNSCGPLKIQALFIADASRNVLWEEGFDLEHSQKVPFPLELKFMIVKGSLLSAISQNQPFSGVVVFDKGPMILAARPILKSNGEGPAKGTVIMGCYLDDKEVQELSQTLQLKLSLFRVNDKFLCKQIPEDLMKLLLNKKDSMEIRAISPKSLLGYGLMRTLNGEPAFVMQSEMARDIYNYGVKTTTLFTSLMGLVLALFTVSIIAILGVHIPFDSREE